jgi:pimeloyl-ACP methyl ester carboxylesterase
MMAPIAASKSSDVAFIVMLAGPGTGFDEIVLFQRAQAMRRAGASPENASLTRSWYRSLYGVSASTLDHESAEKRIRQLSAELDEEVKKKVRWNEERLEKELPGLLRPWWRFANAYDPIATLMRVQCPVLALNGEKDMQVPGTENAAAIERALKLGGNPSFEVKVMPGLNHLLQTAETGSELEYTKIDETISPAALQAISDWVLALEPTNSH